jgi:hypothetical protein
LCVLGGIKKCLGLINPVVAAVAVAVVKARGAAALAAADHSHPILRRCFVRGKTG